MPHYDYRCRACGHAFEIFQSMSEAKLTECPECQGEVERLIGAGAGVIFKGSGFYTTDYRSDSYKKAARKDGGSSTSASGDSSGASAGSGSSGTSDSSSTSSSSSSSESKTNGKGKTKTSSSTEKSSKKKSD